MFVCYEIILYFLYNPQLQYFPKVISERKQMYLGNNQRLKTVPFQELSHPLLMFLEQGKKQSLFIHCNPECEGGVLIICCPTNIIIFTERQVHESAFFSIFPCNLHALEGRYKVQHSYQFWDVTSFIWLQFKGVLDIYVNNIDMNPWCW